GRIEDRRQARRRLLAVVQRQLEVPAAPGEVLADAAVVEIGAVHDACTGGGARNRLRRRVCERLPVDLRRERRLVVAPKRRDGEVERGRVQALNRDIQVLVERELHRLVQRQRKPLARRGGGGRLHRGGR